MMISASLSSTLLTGQVNLPPNDPTWFKLTGISDEFNYNHATQALKRTAMKNKWNFMPHWGNVYDKFGNKAQGYFLKDGENVTVNNGICTLAVKQNPGLYDFPCTNCWGVTQPPYNNVPIQEFYNYTNGMLIAKNVSRLGYYELKFRLPNRSANSQYKTENKGIQPNFWFYNVTPCSFPQPYSEIDVFEVNSNEHYLFCPTMHYGGVDNTGPTQNDAWKDIGWGRKVNGQTIFNAPLNFNIDFADGNFHTVGFEWMPEHVSIYVDGVLQRSTNWQQDIMCEMNMIIDVGAGSGFTGNPNAGTLLPYEYELDYIRYYQFNSQIDPAYSSTIPDYSLLGNFRRQKIELGDYLHTNNAWCNAKVPANKNLVLRAKTSVGLYGSFETDDTSELYIDANDY